MRDQSLISTLTRLLKYPTGLEFSLASNTTGSQNNYYIYSHFCYYMYFLLAKSIEAGLHDTTVWTFGITTATHGGMLSPTLSRQSVTPLGHVDQLHKTSISKQDCYARALTIIGHLNHFSDCVEKLDIKCGGGAEKFDSGLTGLSTTSTPRKFDSVSRRNSTAPGSSGHLRVILYFSLRNS